MDLSKPVEIAENIFWIGYVVPNDSFQCHVYLIRNGDETILIDPGSMITFPVVLEKITSLVKLRDIKYIIMHHQDPDIVGCYSTLESIMPKRERYIITHWRTSMLLKHYNWKTPFYLIDENDWKLKTLDRELEFIFTPYAHFAGAFCTYDKNSEIIFSSDIFGAINNEFKLFADESILDGMKLFHKHYMPHKNILNYALNKIEKTAPKIIAPQHGSIIKEDMINTAINSLKDLECGVYMLNDYVDDIVLLSKVDDIIKEFFENMLFFSSFENVLKNLFLHIQKTLPLKEFRIVGKDFTYLVNDKEVVFKKAKESFNSDFEYSLKEDIKIYIDFNDKLSDIDEKFLKIILDKIKVYLLNSLEKELYIKELKEKEQEFYNKSIKDALTTLFNRAYLEEFLSQKLKEVNRYKFPLTIAMIDVDFFKKVNDTYGHLTGDCVLRELASLMKMHFRGSDFIARYGGEEFLIIMPFTDLKDGVKKMEDFRRIVENNRFCKNSLNITISVGVCKYNGSFTKEEFIKCADEKLYQAKKSGRNRVVF